MAFKQTSGSSSPVGSWKPSKARYEFRTNAELEGKSSSGYCMGYLQANLAILPSFLADDFEQFCELNKAPCPLLYRSKIGELSAGNLAPDSDVRTDLQKYCVSENGIIIRKPGSLTAYPMDDYVSFYIGCSFSFEEAMITAGIPLQNVTENHNVSMFTTNIQCVPVGPFANPMVVSMRPIPKDLVEKALVITAAYDAVHGAPIHIGDPSVIGIEDIYATEFGEPSEIGDLIPMFWACGVTSSLAVRSAKPPLSFSHHPGSMFICDTTVDDYFKVHKPDHGDEEPRLITLTDKPYLASVCSASAIQKVKELAKMIWVSPDNTDGPEDVQVANDFLKIAVRLSHAPSVVMSFLHEKESFSSEMSKADCIQGVMALVKAIQALNKKITIVTQHHAPLIQESIAAGAAEGRISTDGVRVVEWDGHSDMKEIIFHDKMRYRLDVMIAFQVARKPDKDDSTGSFKSGVVNSFYQQVKSWENGLVSIKITADKCKVSEGEASSMDSHTMTTSSLKMAGWCLAAALSVLNQCPIHSRYVRRGIGKRQHFQAGQFFVNEDGKEGVCRQIFKSVTGS